jgi:two-component system, NarL family, invasion response regulator UvrY
MIRVLIAEDHELVRRGVRGLLKDDFHDVVFGEALDAKQTLAAVEMQAWDLVLLDINMPGRNGLDVLQDLKRLYPELPVVILSAFSEKDFAVRAFKLGAAAYVSKDSAATELLAAARKALAGGRYVTPLLAEALAATVAGETPVTPHDLLSNRELQVLRLVALGKSLKEIAAELSLSEKTVGTYRTRISQKMNLSTNVELARYATLHKLVD